MSDALKPQSIQDCLIVFTRESCINPDLNKILPESLQQLDPDWLLQYQSWLIESTARYYPESNFPFKGQSPWDESRDYQHPLMILTQIRPKFLFGVAPDLLRKKQQLEAASTVCSAAQELIRSPLKTIGGETPSRVSDKSYSGVIQNTWDFLYKNKALFETTKDALASVMAAGYEDINLGLSLFHRNQPHGLPLVSIKENEVKKAIKEGVAAIGGNDTCIEDDKNIADHVMRSAIRRYQKEIELVVKGLTEYAFKFFDNNQKHLTNWQPSPEASVSDEFRNALSVFQAISKAGMPGDLVRTEKFETSIVGKNQPEKNPSSDLNVKKSLGS